MTDNYEFSKSTFPQGVSTETPYVSKQFGFVNDINGGVYSANGSSQVNFDLSSIYSSTAMIDPSQMFITIPVVMVSQYTSSNTAGTAVAPASSSSAWATHGLKSGYFHLVSGADLIVNGKTIEQFQPNINSYVNFKLQSQMSQDDLATMGYSLGMGTSIDNSNSVKFNPTKNSSGTALMTGSVAAYPTGTITGTGLVGGNGLSNNVPFNFTASPTIITTGTMDVTATTTKTLSAVNPLVLPGQIITGVGITGLVFVVSVAGAVVTTSVAFTSTATAYTFSDMNFSPDEQGLQNVGQSNAGYLSRLRKYSDVTFGTAQNLYGATFATGADMTTFTTRSQLATEVKPFFEVLATNYMVTYDTAVIRLCDLFDSMKNMCLTKKFDGQLRLYVNSGVVGSVLAPGGSMMTSGQSTTFTGTCPLIQSSLQLIPSTAIGIVSGLFIARATTTNVFGVNLATSGASHAIPSCRCYYPQVTLKPEILRNYISENRSKRICYTSVLFNSFASISSGATYSSLVQSGVSNIRGVLLLPFNSSTTNGSISGSMTTGLTTFSQIQSPFDSAPATTAPISLINLQVSVGGVNQLMNTLNYTWENFIEQVSMYEKINMGDLGISCGLISEKHWTDAYRAYYVDCSRGNLADMMTPRNVNVTFGNNSNATIDVMCFTEYFTEFSIDVETGIITKL